MCGTPEDAPQTTTTYVHRVPNRNPCQTQGLPTSRITTREVPHPQNYDHLHQQNYDQGAYILPASRITTRELASWLAGWLGGLRPGNLSCAWLAGGLAGWLRPREAQRGPERRSVDRTSLSCAWHTYKHTYTLPSQQPRPKPSQATSAKPAATAEAPVDMAWRAPEI